MAEASLDYKSIFFLSVSFSIISIQSGGTHSITKQERIYFISELNRFGKQLSP